MTLGTGPGEALAAVPGQGFGFDENQPVVAEAPGGEWSRFKTYSIFAVRHPTRWASAHSGALRLGAAAARRAAGLRRAPYLEALARACGTQRSPPHARATRQRTFEIWSFVFKFVLKRVALNLKWTYFGKGGFSEERKKARLVAQASWLREGLLRLGPTFIKIGQQARARARTAHALRLPAAAARLDAVEHAHPRPRIAARRALTRPPLRPLARAVLHARGRAVAGAHQRAGEAAGPGARSRASHSAPPRCERAAAARSATRRPRAPWLTRRARLPLAAP